MVKPRPANRVLFGLGLAIAAAVIVNTLVGGMGFVFGSEGDARALTGLDSPLGERLAAMPAAICLAGAFVSAGAQRFQVAGVWLAGYGANAALEGLWLGVLEAGTSGEYDIVISITGTHLIAVASGIALALLARGLRARDRELAEFV